MGDEWDRPLTKSGYRWRKADWFGVAIIVAIPVVPEAFAIWLFWPWR